MRSCTYTHGWTCWFDTTTVRAHHVVCEQCFLPNVVWSTNDHGLQKVNCCAYFHSTIIIRTRGTRRRFLWRLLYLYCSCYRPNTWILPTSFLAPWHPTFTLALEVDVVCLFMCLSVCLNRYENHHPLRVGEKRNRHVRFNKTIVCNCDSWDRVFYYLVYSDRNEPKVSGFVRFHSAGILSTRGMGRELLQWLLYSL